MNGIPFLIGYAHSTLAKHDIAHNGGIIYLTEGEKVRLEIQEGHLDGGWKDSTFSGYLLYENVA